MSFHKSENMLSLRVLRMIYLIDAGPLVSHHIPNKINVTQYFLTLSSAVFFLLGRIHYLFTLTLILTFALAYLFTTIIYSTGLKHILSLSISISFLLSVFQLANAKHSNHRCYFYKEFCSF